MRVEEREEIAEAIQRRNVARLLNKSTLVVT